MHEAGEWKIETSYEELGWLIGCSPEVAARCILELKRTETADVLIRNGTVKITSRRMRRELKDRKLTNLRVKKHRDCNGDVTPSVTAQSKSKSKSNKKEDKEAETAVAADAAAQSPGTSQPSVKADSVDKARQLDPVEQRIWTDGVDLLTRSGTKDPRPLLGRWAKDHGREVLAEAIAVTQAKNPPDPKSFIGGVLRKRKETKSAMRVGASDYDPEVYSCKACFDTGLRSVPDPDAEFSWMLKEIPCEECKL